MRPYLEDVPIIAIDFDGVIRQGDFRDENMPPVDGAIEGIKELHSMGCELILWTSRIGEGMEEAKEYLKEYGIYDCFAGFNEPAPSTYFPQGRKIFAHWYVDDLNFGGFSSYTALVAEVRKELEELKNKNEEILN